MDDKRIKRVRPKRGRPPKGFDGHIHISLNNPDKNFIHRGYHMFCLKHGDFLADGTKRNFNDWGREILIRAAKEEINKTA